MHVHQQRLRLVRWLLLGQLFGAVVSGLIGLVFFDRSAALGAFLGGMIVFLPHSWFAWRAFRYQGARAAKQVVRSFYMAEAGKMLFSMALFALVFILVRPLNAPAFFAGFTGVLTLNWLIPLIVNLRSAPAVYSNQALQEGITDHGKR
ncbi:MAG: hypothetical protein CSB44_10320 [Gammaproteobacteria bacterium]|nr:MAG: hypothetical protein CSB44_10320 [Gammaproteobacteria bacterium]PIE37570.1 MAG: hypothetical protein CSA54_01180 [Gammaproteobacteria bacterium]